MLDRCSDTGRFEAAHIGSRDIGNDNRIIGNRALADQRVEVEPVALQFGSYIQHRRKIPVDAERSQLLPVNAPKRLRLLGPNIRRQARKRR